MPPADVPHYLCVFRAAEDVTDDVIDLGQDPDFPAADRHLGNLQGRTSAALSAPAATSSSSATSRPHAGTC